MAWELISKLPAIADLEQAVWHFGGGKSKERALSTSRQTLSTKSQERVKSPHCVVNTSCWKTLTATPSPEA